MSDHYLKIIGYTIEKLKNKSFQFDPIKEFFVEHYIEGDNLLPPQLHITFEFRSPDYDVIELNYQENVIKSHEKEVVTQKLMDHVKNAIENKYTNLQRTISKSLMYKFKVQMNRRENIQVQTNLEYRIDTIDIIFDTKRISARDVISFIMLFQFEEMGFCDRVSVHIKEGNKESREIRELTSLSLVKTQLEEVFDHLSMEDKEQLHELYCHPLYQKIWFQYLLPEGFEAAAEVTFDMFQEGAPPQKRRTVQLGSGGQRKFHEAIRSGLSEKKFQEIITLNDIAGLYVSTRSTKGDVLYAIVDIDLSDIVRKTFPLQAIWDITVSITEGIIKTASQLGLDKPTVNFSGSRGTHIVYRVEKDALDDIEGEIDLPIFHYYQLPGLSTLKKNSKSCYHDKFKFFKTLMQSLCLHTIYFGDVDISYKVRRKLRISHLRDLFKLSVFSPSQIGILLDTSSTNKGVFRIFSAHPSSKLISIPLINPDTLKIYDKYRDFEAVREQSKIETVLERVIEGDIEDFLLLPTKITRLQLTRILRPDRLLGTFFVLLRFGPRFVLNRSPMSFTFWHNYFTTKAFYEYAYHMIFLHDCRISEDTVGLKELLHTLSKKIGIKNQNRFMSIIKEHLFHKKTSLPVLEERLQSLYQIEFYFSLKSPVFLKQNVEDLSLLFSDKFGFQNFLNQTVQILSPLLESLLALMLNKNRQNLSQRQITILMDFSDKFDSIIELVKYYRDHPNAKIIDLTDRNHKKEMKSLKLIHSICIFYYEIVNFLNKFYKLNERAVRR